MSEQDEDVAVDTNTEDEEAANSNENSVEETVDLSAELERERQARREITARAKKAEEDLRKLKETRADPQINSNPQLSEELKLIARGLSDEAIEKAKIIAKGNGTNLTEALKDDMFIAYQDRVKENERKEKAKLGASKGSGESQDDALIKPDMTREEHQEAFKKAMGI